MRRSVVTSRSCRTTTPGPQSTCSEACTFSASRPRESSYVSCAVRSTTWPWTCVGVELSEENHRQLWVPEGFAHGFVVLTESADFVYKTTTYYAPEHERCLAWDDPSVGITWPIEGQPSLSGKDQHGKSLAELECFD